MIHPDIFIEQPKNFSNAILEDVINLIVLGGQIKAPDAKVGVHRSTLLGVLQINGEIVATACCKNPRDSYRERVFAEAMATDDVNDYTHELGYIATKDGFGGNGYCQLLLNKLVPLIENQPMFATTRKPEMSHILKKFGFRQSGKTYKKDLQLFIRPANS